MYLNGRDAVNKENTTKKCNTRNPEMCERVKKKQNPTSLPECKLNCKSVAND